MPVRLWINDGLMAIFFFVVGLEVKREIIRGELREIKKAVLPIAAALGGMLVPAAIYLLFQAGEPGARGWGIPMATDIAFVVGCMALLGQRLPNGLRVMLLTLAIADDIGAILVIAIGYSEALDWHALGLSLAGIMLFVTLLKLGVRNNLVYLLMGFGIWFEFHASGIHATVSGVIIGLMTPIRSWVSPRRFNLVIQKTLQELQECRPQSGAARYALIRQMQRSARDALSPLERLETDLHPWVGFIIMPLFALANAGVVLDFKVLRDPLSVAVICGLFFGKPAGIFLFSWLAVQSKLARLPEGVSWTVLAAGGVLGGIGFTMALFIGGLALQGELLDAAKVGVIAGSTLSAVVGMALIFGLRRQTSTDVAGATDSTAER
jgi:NhaA family Na+:H+ antiporter